MNAITILVRGWPPANVQSDEELISEDDDKKE